MTTAREFAENATAAVCGILHVPPSENAENVADVIELAVKKATLEREALHQKRVEESQAAAQERLDHLVSASPAVIYSFKATGDYAPTFVGRNITDLFGYEPSEYLENPSFWRDRVHPDDLARVETEITRLFANGDHALEYRFRRKNGTYCWVNDEQRLIRDEAGKPLEIVGSWSDITARKKAENALVKAKARQSYLLNASPAVIYSYNATGDYLPTYISENISDLLGYEPQEYLEGPDFWRDRVHPEDLPRILGEQSRLFEEGRLSTEYRFRKKDGSYCWIGDDLRLVRNEEGDPVEVVGSWSDVTARKQLGEALVATQDRMVHLLSSSPTVIYSFQASGDYEPTFISENLKDLLATSRRNTWKTRTFGGTASILRTSPPWKPKWFICSRKVATPSNIASARRMVPTAGLATNGTLSATRTARRSKWSAHGTTSVRVRTQKTRCNKASGD
jgi:PAS domain S-box-containing protein